MSEENLEKKMTGVDMLNGPLLMKILWFSLPLAVSSLLEQLFNSVDVAVVGHFVGSNALAAVGSNAPVIGLLINLFMGVSMGANAVISTLIGQRDYTRIERAVSTVAMLAIISGMLLMVLGICLARPILTSMSTPVEVIDMAILYLRIYFLGMPFFMIYVFGSAILRSKGDTRRPLNILIVAGIVNTILNLVFVLLFHMGVEGVAISTSIANAVSAFQMIRLLRRESIPFRLNIKDMHIDRRELSRMLKIGVPAGLQGMVFSISNVVVQSQINSYGADVVAGSSAALNFEYYCYFIIQAFNGAAISFIAQNYGARSLHRVKRIFWICMGGGIVFSGSLNIIFAYFSPFFLHIFSSSEAIIPYGMTRMHIVLALQWIACSYEISGSALRGMGHSLLPALLTVVGTCLLRMVWVFFVCPLWPGFDHLMIVYPLSWILTGAMVVIAYARFLKQAGKYHVLS